MFCKNCGNEIKDGVKFCGKCGASIENDDLEQQNTTEDNENKRMAVAYQEKADKVINAGTNGRESLTVKKNSKVCLVIISFAAVIIFLIVKLVSCSGDSYYEIGESAELDGLEISVTSFDIMYSIASGDYIAEDGMTFAVVGVTVYNDDNSGQDFMDSIRSYSKLVYEDKEFSMASFFLPPNDLLADVYIAPMTSKDGYIVFKIPEKVAENEDEIMIKFIKDNGGVDGKNMEWKEDIESITFDIK